MVEKLRTSDDNVAVIDENESANIVVKFTHDNAPITKNHLITILATLFDRKTESVINGKENINVKDANNGSVINDGTLTWRLTPQDNAIVGTSLPSGSIEEHVVLFTWTWDDEVQVRTGKKEVYFDVRKLADPT